MSQYPVEIPYSFSVDLNIKEEQIPFVKISMVTDNLPEEAIDFVPNQAVSVYSPTWYVYGDDTLLYVGGTITGAISSSNFWRAKYIDNSRVFWSSDNYDYRIYNNTHNPIVWTITSGKYRISCPMRFSFPPTEGTGVQNPPYLDLPYSTITVKRNIGITLAQAQAVNPSYDVPDYYTFPSLTKRMYRRHPNVQMTTSKIWLKVGVNKYRLIVYGRFYKWTNKQIRSGEGNYIEGTYNYVPDYHIGLPGIPWQFWSFYKLDSYTEVSKNIALYEPLYNPSNVKLLVNYINNSGQNEVREYKIQT